MINNESPNVLNQPLTEPTPVPPQPLAHPPEPTIEQKVLELLKALFSWGLSVGFLLFVPLLFVVPYMIYLATTGASVTAEALTQDKNVIFLSILGVIPAHLLTLLAVWAIYSKLGRVNFWKNLNFTWPRSLSRGQTVLFSAVLAFLLLGVGLVVTYFLGGQKTDLDKLIESSYQARIATACLAFLTAPLVEEVIYRGLVYPAAAKLVGMGAAIAIVSIMFAGVHVFQYRENIGVIVVISILSIALTTIRALSDSLLPPFLIHLFFNGVQSLYLAFEPFMTKPENAVPPAAPALVQVFLTLRQLL